MKRILRMIEEFYRTFNDGHLIGTEPRTISIPRHRNRVDLLMEEVREYDEATRNKDLVEIADALADITYILAGAIVEHGLQDRFSTIFEEVHRSNMTKACDDEKGATATIMFHEKNGKGHCVAEETGGGKYIVRRVEDAKIMKNHLYSPANLKPIIDARPPEGIEVDDIMENGRSLKRDDYLVIDRRKIGDDRIILEAKEIEGVGVMTRSYVESDNKVRDLSTKILYNVEILEETDIDDDTKTIYSIIANDGTSQRRTRNERREHAEVPEAAEA